MPKLTGISPQQQELFSQSNTWILPVREVLKLYTWDIHFSLLGKIVWFRTFSACRISGCGSPCFKVFANTTTGTSRTGNSCAWITVPRAHLILENFQVARCSIILKHNAVCIKKRIINTNTHIKQNLHDHHQQLSFLLVASLPPHLALSKDLQKWWHLLSLSPPGKEKGRIINETNTMLI